jgi:hypothetical protein
MNATRSARHLLPVFVAAMVTFSSSPQSASAATGTGAEQAESTSILAFDVEFYVEAIAPRPV